MKRQAFADTFTLLFSALHRHDNGINATTLCHTNLSVCCFVHTAIAIIYLSNSRVIASSHASENKNRARLVPMICTFFFSYFFFFFSIANLVDAKWQFSFVTATDNFRFRKQQFMCIAFLWSTIEQTLVSDMISNILQRNFN